MIDFRDLCGMEIVKSDSPKKDTIGCVKPVVSRHKVSICNRIRSKLRGFLYHFRTFRSGHAPYSVTERYPG